MLMRKKNSFLISRLRIILFSIPTTLIVLLFGSRRLLAGLQLLSIEGGIYPRFEIKFLNMAPVISMLPALPMVLCFLILCYTSNVDSFGAMHSSGSLSRRSTTFSSRNLLGRERANRRERDHSALKSQEITPMESSRVHKIDFVAPLLDYGYPPAVKDLELESRSENGRDVKPILLYLPGFDGTYICPFIQFPELGTEFEVWCMTIAMEDRSTYGELKTVVLDFLTNYLALETGGEESAQKNDSQNNGNGRFAGIFGGNATKIKQKISGRPIYIAGESFGGILASDVAITLLNEHKRRNDDEETRVNLQGLVLINPATCYDRSQLAIAGPPVAESPLPFYIPRLFSSLVPLFTDEFSLAQLFLILQSKALPSIIDNARREAYMGRVALSLPTKLDFMPPATLSWRLKQWLETGSAAFRESSFEDFPSFRSLIVVGEKDKTLPSIAEAERLANKVMNPDTTKIHVVNGAGHASTCGSRLDLAAEIRNCFPELQKTPVVTKRKRGKRESKGKKQVDNKDISSQAADDNSYYKRTSMKLEAKKGKGPNFGMEERYDKANIGLNPLLYWERSNFRSVKRSTEIRNIRSLQNDDMIQYRKSIYTIPD